MGSNQPLVEHVLSMPVLNPEGGSRRSQSHSFRLMGKIDRLEDGRIIDWKGVSDPHRFIHQRTVAFQPEIYALALRDAGYPVKEIIYRLVMFPTIKLCGKDKNAAAYENRCLGWIGDKAERVIEHPVFLNENRIKQARAFIWEVGKRILDCRRHDRWLPNSHACYTWNRECNFKRLCETVVYGGDLEGVIADEYQVAEDLHPELDGQAKGKNILTHTSMTTLTLCEPLYYWLYERCLRRRSDQNGEALWLGSAMHVGLEAYANEGREAGLKAVSEWEKANPALGADGVRQAEQQVAKAKAMVRAAAEKWPFE